MNLQVTLIMVYLFGEFGYIMYVENAALVFQVAGDSSMKIEQIKRVNEEIFDQIWYRYSQEDVARIEADKRINKFESHSKTKFTKNMPDKGMRSKWLWKKAKKALDKYKKIKSKFDSERFCESPMSKLICKRVFENSYFKNEKLTYDNSKSTTGNGCVIAPYSLISEQMNVRVDYILLYKSCLAKRKNDDGTEGSVKVFLKSAYKQPFIGRWRFFVLYSYIWNQRTGQWERPSDPNNDLDAEFRYEAYLSLGWLLEKK